MKEFLLVLAGAFAARTSDSLTGLIAGNPTGTTNCFLGSIRM